MTEPFEPTEQESRVAGVLYSVLAFSGLPVLVAVNLTHSWWITGIYLGGITLGLLLMNRWVARNHGLPFWTALRASLRRKS